MFESIEQTKASATLAPRCLLSQRGDRAKHSSRLLGWAAFDFAVLFELRNDVLHHFAALFDMSHLATTEQDGHLHLVVVLKEANCLLHLKLNIVLARLGSNAYLFELRLMLFAFRSPLTLVVLELSIVHDAANRWFGFGRDLDEIKPVFASLFKCVGCRDDA